MTGKLNKVCPCGKKFTTNYSKKIFCTRDCHNDRNQNCSEYSAAQRNRSYKYNYGIDLEKYNELFNTQNSCCAICKKHQSAFKKRLHVDHEHESGGIRGLLCHNCNLAIGRLYEDPVIIKAALEYVS